MSLIIFLFLFASCDGNSRKNTPNEFLNRTVVAKDNYSKDSSEIIRQLRNILKKHEGFFYSKQYFEGTVLIIDTFLYSPNLNKLAVFVITKNPTSRQLFSTSEYAWYYDATCYLGIRQNDTICMSWIGPSFSNFSDRDELSETLRNEYFTKYAKIKNVEGDYRYRYNIGDVRFWDCPIWAEVEEKKRKRIEFEEEKKKHPENIYEPKQ
ncbi:hypothetical protein ACFOW1_01860 [Parasediminibacterium paludis]|uniref:Lipoprotein n=1 Tax=Parasediminibacterium paludis TaxID=908966 RepID=A0ABV8PTZ6_9BACT